MSTHDVIKAIAGGALACIAMLGAYFVILTLISGLSFALSQFADFWPYIVALAVGFGGQVGLYLHLKRISEKRHRAHCVLAASGTTSSAAMLACCTHYLTNILPLLGATGLVTFVAQYQIEMFWIGLAFNAAGFAYVWLQVYAAKQAFRESHA